MWGYIWKKPKENFIKVTGWKVGQYIAIPLQSPFQKGDTIKAIPVEIKGVIPGKSYIRWPSEDIEWLKFIQ